MGTEECFEDLVSIIHTSLPSRGERNTCFKRDLLTLLFKPAGNQPCKGAIRIVIKDSQDLCFVGSDTGCFEFALKLKYLRICKAGIDNGGEQLAIYRSSLLINHDKLKHLLSPNCIF